MALAGEPKREAAETRNMLVEAGPAILLLFSGGLLTIAAEVLDINGGRLMALALTFAATAAFIILLDGHRREERARREVARADARAAAARAEVRHLDGLLKTVGDTTPDLIFARDRNARVRYANRALLNLIGAPASEEALAALSGGGGPELKAHLDNDRRVMEAGRPMVFFEPFTGADGVLRTYRSTKAPVFDEDGAAWGVCGVATDVTDDVTAREALERSERYVRELTDALPHVVLSTRGDGRGFYANAFTYQFLGIPPEQHTLPFWLNFIHPADIDAYTYEATQAAAQKTRLRTRIRVRRHDGAWRWMLVNVEHVPDQGEGPGTWVTTATDIQDLFESELKRDEATRQLNARNAFLDTLIETAPVALVVADELGMIHSFTRQAEDLFGWSEREVLGRSLELLMPPDHRVGHATKFQSVSLDHERRVIGTERRVMGLRRDGTLFPMELHLGDFMEGGRRFFTGFVRDLTEREQREAHLQDLRSQIVDMAGVTAMGELASAIIHEVAQPMAACSYYLAAVETPEAAQRLTKEQKVAALTGAANEARRAQEIIRRLRGLVQNGQAEKALADVETVIREGTAVATIGVANVPVSLELGPGLGMAEMDKVQIHQVIVNLIRNAYQAMLHVEAPRLTIRARREADRIVVSIADNGDGVPDDVRARLFEPFSSARVGGMGIGLAISRTIVEAHGGQIWCEPSAPGLGAVFSFSIGTAA